VLGRAIKTEKLGSVRAHPVKILDRSGFRAGIACQHD
jgi:hypothetical protein